MKKIFTILIILISLTVESQVLIGTGSNTGKMYIKNINDSIFDLIQVDSISDGENTYSVGELAENDSSWRISEADTTKTDVIKSKSSDTIEIDDNADFKEGIKVRVDTIPFSASMTFDFKGNATTQVINMTNNASLAIDCPMGTFYELVVYQDVTGTRTLTITGATKAENSGDQNETGSTVSLYQFRKFADGTIYYWIDSPN